MVDHLTCLDLIISHGVGLFGKGINFHIYIILGAPGH